MSTLRTRKPTGRQPWPLILVEGPEKSGKSWAWATLSTSEKVGRVIVCVIGESDGDAYAALPGAEYELIDHNGTYSDILEQLQAAVKEVPCDGDKPPVLVLDSLSNLWTLLCDEAQRIANRRAEKKGRKKADEEAQITMDLWNHAKNRWRRVMDAMMSFEGIGVATARGKEVAEIENGTPTDSKIWKIEGEKTLSYDVDVWVRVAGSKAILVGARSVKAGINPAMDKIINPFSLEYLIFDILGCDQIAGDVSYQPLKAETEPKKAKPKPADYSKDAEWKKQTSHIQALIKECGLNGDTFERVQAVLIQSKGVKEYAHLSPGYLARIAGRLQDLSPEETSEGEMPPRMAHILDVIGLSPEEATKQKNADSKPSKKGGKQ